MEIYRQLCDDNHWKNKYFPKSIKDLEINPYTLALITNWIKNYNKNKLNQSGKKTNKKNDIDDIDLEDTCDEKIDEKVNEKTINSPNKSCMIITGNHGIGKTSVVVTILKSLDYMIYQIDFNKIDNFKDIVDFIEKPIFGNSITEKINSVNIKNKVLLIDNLESILSINQKKFLIKLTKYNDGVWKIPIIYISNNKHNKLMYFIKKLSYEVKMNNPSKETMENILCKICMNENINLNDEKIIDEIISHSGYDIRSMITNLQTLKNLYGNKYISLDDFKTFIHTNKMKDNDPSIYTASHKLFYGYDNIDNVTRIFEMEKTIMPLMIQQHYIDYLKKNNASTINKISKSLAYGDILENYIYDNNIYDIRDVQSFYHCVYPSYLLTNKLNPKNINMNKFTSYFEYPKDLNKTSIRCINHTKNINPSNKVFTGMSINDYLYFNKIIRTVIKSNDFEKCNEYLKDYDCNISLLESVLKINKIDENKFSLSTKIKKKLLDTCDNIVEKEITKSVKAKKQKKNI